jgi:hypothetical protein
MPDFQIIQSISDELRTQIVETLDSAPGASFGLSGDIDRISLEPPDQTMGNDIVASLYLYHIDIDGHLRNQRPTPDRTADDLFHRPPLPLRLRYLLTPYGEADGTNQVIAALVLQHLQDNPNFDTVLDAALDDAQGAAPIRLRVRFEPMTPEGQTQLWSAMNTAMRLSVMLVVDIVGLESGRSPSVVPRVGQNATAYDVKPREQVDG